MNEKSLFLTLLFLLITSMFLQILSLGIEVSKCDDSLISIRNFSESESGNYTFLVNNWSREIKIGSLGGLSVLDYFQITSKVEEDVSRIFFILPTNASNYSVQDIFGTYSSDRLSVKKHDTHIELQILLRETLKSEEKLKMLVDYSLPSEVYIVPSSWKDYSLTISLGKPENWYVSQFVSTVFLPEGGEYQGSSKVPSEVNREVFSMNIKFTEANIEEFEEDSIVLTYSYIILWAALRPALWIGTAIAIFILIYLVRRFMMPSTSVVKKEYISSDTLIDFIDTYEERRRLSLELASLERQVSKGKLSKRRYRSRKSSLDGHLARLSKKLKELRSRIGDAGGQFLKLITQLETAEAKIQTLEQDITRVEVRFRRGEISEDAHKSLLAEYNRIKENAENTIDETLLRLREEIR